MDLKIGGFYNWKYQRERLIYVGKDCCWHQFKKIGDPRDVWCEVLDEDLHMIEETTPRRITMGTYTDTYVEMLQQDLQHHYKKHFEISEELGEALMASEAKDEELTAAGQLLNLQMDATAQVEKKLVDALGVLSDRDIEIERLTFALKDKDNELESVRDEHRTQIDGLMGDLDEMRQLFHNSVTRILEKEEEIERLTRKNKKPFKVAELRWLIDGHKNVLDEHRTAILEVREVINQNKETLSAAQREMLATLDRHDALISNAFGCIDNHSDSIYKHQQSIDALWDYVKSIAAHINTGGTPDGNQD